MGQEPPLPAMKQDGAPPTRVNLPRQIGLCVDSSFDYAEEMQKYRTLLHSELQGMIFTHL